MKKKRPGGVSRAVLVGGASEELHCKLQSLQQDTGKNEQRRRTGQAPKAAALRFLLLPAILPYEPLLPA
ncbi:hypothetical protein ABH899_004685 [Paenibacillus sp. RC84]